MRPSHCLFCSWDGDEEGGAPALAAHLGERAAGERRDDPRHPEAHDVEDHRDVARLRVDRVKDGAIVRWFSETARARYPHAAIVERPGRAKPDNGDAEGPFSPVQTISSGLTATGPRSEAGRAPTPKRPRITSPTAAISTVLSRPSACSRRPGGRNAGAGMAQGGRRSRERDS